MASEPPKVFISYNRADRDWAEWIAGVIERGGYQPIIQAWDFRPGQNFVLRMQQATMEADITIAVLSEAYLKAEFTQPEWAAAFAQDPTGEKRQLIPARVTPCTLHGLLKPIIYVDLVNLGEQEAERALLDGLKPSGKPAQPPPFPGKRAEPSISTAPFPPSLARLHGVPDLPPHYLPREVDLAGLKQKLLSGDASVAITGQGQALGVQGMGGIGKTVLAAALAHDSEVRHAFPDGIYWLTLGQKPNLLDLQNRLFRQLAGSKETLITEQVAKDALREALEGRSALVVVDDAWTIDQADAFSVAAPPVRLLITTRNNEVLVGLGAEEHRVDVLSSSDALKMLAQWVGQKSPDKLPPEAAKVTKECGYLPLALAMIGAMIRLRPTAWKDALDRLKRSDLAAIKRAFPGYPYPDLLRAIEVSVEGLEAADRERYLDLAVFPEDQPIPEEPLRVLWNLDEVDTRDCMGRLVARSLATWATNGASLILHDLQRDLIHKRREEKLPALHLRLVKGWNALSKLNSYALRSVPYHLVQAGRKDDLRQLLLNYNYLETKLAATDTSALTADYDYLPIEADLQLVQSAIRLSAHVLARDPRQLAGQLTGRLLGSTNSKIEALLTQALEMAYRPWLRPLTPSLTAPGGPLIRILEGHSGSVREVAITPDGRRAVSASWDNTLRVWDLESGQSLRTLQGHSSEVIGVAITPDGRRAVSASYDNTLRIWDLESGQSLRTLESYSDLVPGVAITPDGRLAVSACEDDTLRVWDLESGQSLRTLKGHSSSVTGLAVAITLDGRRAVSASEDQTLRVWDLESGQCLRTLQGHSRAVLGVAITPDGRRAVSASGDQTLRVWDLESGQCVSTLEGHSSSVNGIAITLDGRRAVSASYDNTLRVWDLESGQSLRTLQGHSSSVNGIAITLDGRRAVSASGDQTLRVWDLESGQTLRTLQGHSSSVNGIAITLDGRRAVSASGDNTLRVWDLESGQTLRTLEGHSGSVSEVAITPDGRRAVSASGDNTLRVWDLESGQTLRTLKGHSSSVSGVAITPDGRSAVSASYDRTLRIWDLESGQSLRTLKGHSSSVSGVAITPDGRRAVSASGDNTLRVWDLESGQTLRTLEGHSSSVSGVAITPDGRRAVSASGDNTLRVWDLESGQTLRTLEGHSSSVNGIAITPDGRRAVSAASYDRTLRVWDLESGQTLRTLEGHTDKVNAVAVTRDGRRAVSASGDKTLRLWNLESGKEIATFIGESDMLSCAITPVGGTITAGDLLGRVHLMRFVEADETKRSVGETKIQLLRRKEQAS